MRWTRQPRLAEARRVVALTLACVTLWAGCGVAMESGLSGPTPAASATAARNANWNPMTPTVPMTVADAQGQLSLKLVVPETLPAGVRMTDIEAWPADDLADVRYGPDLSGAAGNTSFMVIERRAPFDPASDALWPPHAGVTTDTWRVGAVPVTRYAAAWEQCRTVTEYAWQQGETAVILSTFDGSSSQGAIEQFIAATIGATPTAAPPPMPAPSRNAYGEYCDLSAEQAAPLAAFQLRLPADPPAPFTVAGVQLVHVPQPDEPTASPPATVATDADANLNQALITVGTDAPNPGGFIRLTESAFDPQFAVGPPVMTDMTTLTIAGIEVTRLSEPPFAPPADPATPVTRAYRYSWRSDDVAFDLAAALDARPGAQLSDADLERLVTAIIGDT